MQLLSKSLEPVALVHSPAAVSMFAAGFSLNCEKVQVFRVKGVLLDTGSNPSLCPVRE